MKVQISLNGITTAKDIPTSWDEVTFGQFLELDKCKEDVVQAVALFTGTPYETLRRARIVDLSTVVNVLGFLKTPVVPVVPKNILKYDLPQDLDFVQVQQYLDLKHMVMEAEKMTPMEKLARYTLYVATFACACHNAYGKYGDDYAEAMKDEFLNAPCTEVLGIGNFTLARLIGLKHGTPDSSQNQSSALKRFRLVLAAYRIRLVLFLRSLTWRKRLG